MRTGPALLLLAGLLNASPGPAAPAPPRRATPPVRRAPAAAPAPAAKPAELTPDALAKQVMALENIGAYGRAAMALRDLRVRVQPDADLELAMALDEARAGLRDTAWVRLHGAELSAALGDSLARERFRTLPPERDRLWLDGRFDGWHWYVARANAELALTLGGYGDAYRNALIAVTARPYSGADQLLLALTAGLAHHPAAAREAARRAVRLDPLLPEAHYLSALWSWRDGDRAAARAALEAAVARDSSFRQAGVSLARLRLPGARPDSLPTRFLTGARRVAMLTSSVGPKLEENPDNDQIPGIFGLPSTRLPDTLQAQMKLQKPLHFYVTVLVDENGRVQLVDLPWIGAGQMPEAFIGFVHAAAGTWRFKPAVKLGRPVRAWATVEFTLNL